MRNNHLIREIEKLKQKLEVTAQQYKYNLNHPHVVAVSKRLDQLIAEHMRNNND